MRWLNEAERGAFWARTDQLPFPSSCWDWNGETRDGRGVFELDGAMVDAARVSFRLSVGGFTEDVQIVQTCGNALCVRPSHLDTAARIAWKRGGSAKKRRKR